MQQFATLLGIACGQEALMESDSSERRLQLVIGGLLGSLVFAALWGLAAGSSSWGLALSNTYKLPMVIMGSAISALPAGLLTWKLVGARYRASNLMVTFIASLFGGCLVLAVLSPLVALYYHSSAAAGPVIGMGSALLAIVVATALFLRAALRALPATLSRATVVVPALVVVCLQLATLVQFIALASPVLPELTPFDGGVDTLLGH